MKNSISMMTKSIRDLFKEKRFLEIGLLVVFCVQFIISIYYNLCLIDNHMGFDSSWSYLKAALIWNEKSLNSGIWVDQTSIFLDSSMLLAAILYGVTGKLLQSYGVANLIVLVGILWCILSILKKMDLGLTARLFAINLVICPYLTNGFSVINDLGYFNNVISGPAFYSLRAFIVLLVVREWMMIKREQKFGFWGCLSLLLCALAGASSGIFIIVVILLPYLLYEIECLFIENNYKVLVKKEAIYGYLCLISVTTGKLFANHILNITVSDQKRTWTSLTMFRENIAAPFLGFLKLLGVLPVDNASVEVLSGAGMNYLFPICILGVVLLSLGYTIWRLKEDYKEKEGFVHFTVNAVAINFLVFGLFNAKTGDALFEERYLVCIYMIIILMVAYYIDNLNGKLIFGQFVSVALFIALVGNNYVSNKVYVNNTNESWQLSEVQEIVDSQDAKLIYFWGDNIITTGRVMRVLDLEHVYKVIGDQGGYYHWGDYKYLEDNEDYTGSTLLVVQNGSGVVPEHIMSQYTLVRKLNDVAIYRCSYNPIDMTVGMTGEESFDYPSTGGMIVQNGNFVGNSFVSDGTEGYVMWGPNSKTSSGNYDFFIDYHYLSGEKATFDIALDQGTNVVGSRMLDTHSTQMCISDVVLEAGHTLEYRVFCEEGTKIQIDKITIVKK